ncbi:multidrug efflux SMR transporter [Parvibaculum sp.]|jgi:quaternary ammonium compound-resistance protein SugE|uniref:DMT family transporter n=1 Tax=Parvibaculum sp. TaxID=2024848 RepID=UPI001B014AC0|nr:multidrug efflux SMR transporter [Parvibaculum sp.]MBO6634774.1 multidrug efflux SMR transporter [Parvibaculum sp.]MBO6679990.1 multidrug efflux SMR transporter [Parvibaculum sp.]MBO6683551.1 multidrug efflux SMR transporter [Parvibaculum sp.]MBO6904679.1 multidrug efflux SMR transporter [Parvibaculum sp.]
MAWIYLLIASAAEIVWAFTLKASDGFTRPLMVVFNIAALLIAVWFLVQAMRTLPLGTAYAVWTGIGVLGAAVLGVLLLGESASPLRLSAIALIVTGVAMLKLVEG